MKKFLFVAFALCAIAVVSSDAAKKKVHTIGDSTMTNYATDGSTDKRGWCQMLQQFFNSDSLTVNNRGKSGSSTRSFYTDDSKIYWKSLIKGGFDEMQSGDYLIIQFAHNDEKDGGADGLLVHSYYTNHTSEFTAEPSTIGTNPTTTYKEYLRAFINEAKAMGVKPILVSGICRKYFKDNNGKSINATGQHNLYQSFTKCDGTTYSTGNSLSTDDHSMDYPYQMSQVAAEYDDVPYINLTAGTKELYESYGDAYCTENLFCKDDGTHVSALGATLIARKFATILQSQAQTEPSDKKKALLQELAENLVLNSDISFSPSSGDLGEAYTGMNLTKEFYISAFGLKNADGNVTISTTDGFLVSTDKTTWSNSISVPYSGNTLISTVYVQAPIKAAGTITGTLTATDGNASKSLDLTAKGLSMTGGEEATLSTTATLTGMTEVATSKYNIEGGTWPAGEIDEVSTRYIQYQATVPDGKEFSMDKISLKLCGIGNNVCYHAYYATKADFSDQVLLKEGLNMTSNETVSVSKDIVKTIKSGESVYVRIYPWVNSESAATETYISVSDVAIHGMLASAGGSSITINGATVDFPMSGDASQLTNVIYGDVKTEACFEETQSVTLGSGITVSGTRNLGSYPTATKFYNNSGAAFGSDRTDAQCVTFTITPKEGFVFIPTKLEFGASRIGTSGGNVAITVEGKGSSNDLGTFTALGSYKPADGVSYWGEFSGDITGLASTKDTPLVVKLYLQSLNAKKETAFHDVKITGVLSGTGGGSDTEAPTVTSTSPTDGATGVSSTGKIVVNYSELVEKGSGTVTITGNGETKAVEPTIINNYITFPFVSLTYGKTYTVNIPEGYVVDMSGNKAAATTFSFTVMERTKPAARTVNAIVDSSLKQLSQKDGVVAATADMPAQYRTLQAAIDAAPSAGTTPYIIYVKNGTYRDPNFTFTDSYGTAYTDRTPSSTATETERISGGINEFDSCRIVRVNKPNINIIGQSRDNVIISTDRQDGSMSWGSDTKDLTHWDHSRVWYHIGAGATFEVQAGGTDFHLENVTVDNENWTEKKLAGPQALCFNVSGDRAVLNNIRTRSYQDTYYNGSSRTFVNNSEIHGAVDFIYGNGDVWFENCVLNINRQSGGYIVAPSHPDGTKWGYVFNNTRITTDLVKDPSTYSIWLGRPWHGKPKTVYLHTTMELTPMDSLFYETMGGLPAVWAVYDFHNAAGQAFKGSKAVARTTYYYTDSSTGQKVYGYSKNTITDEEAAQYTISNVLSGDESTNKSGYWDPTPVVEKTTKPEPKEENGVITWTADPYAICYVVQVNGEAVAFPTETQYTANAGDKVIIQSMNEYGALSDASDEITVTSASGINTVNCTLNNDSRTCYNIAGQRISAASAKGIVIRGGHKFVK